MPEEPAACTGPEDPPDTAPDDSSDADDTSSPGDTSSPSDTSDPDDATDAGDADANVTAADATDEDVERGVGQGENPDGTGSAAGSGGAKTDEPNADSAAPGTAAEPDADASADANGPADADIPADADVPADVRRYERFSRMDGARYERVNDFLRDRTYVTAREWAIARLCADFRTETGVEMTKVGEHLPELVPFMTDSYTPQAVDQARSAFEDKVRKAGATFVYGAMSDFFTAEGLDDVMYEATEVAKFLLEVEGVDLAVEEELAAEERISSTMREVREKSAALRHDGIECPHCGHEFAADGDGETDGDGEADGAGGASETEGKSGNAEGSEDGGDASGTADSDASDRATDGADATE
jgi:hypothetical protein